eukprot:2165327-Lingulodinium_polyedra.AAC.1
MAIASSGVVGPPVTLAATPRSRSPAKSPGVVGLAAAPVEDADDEAVAPVAAEAPAVGKEYAAGGNHRTVAICTVVKSWMKWSCHGRGSSAVEMVMNVPAGFSVTVTAQESTQTLSRWPQERRQGFPFSRNSNPGPTNMPYRRFGSNCSHHSSLRSTDIM